MTLKFHLEAAFFQSREEDSKSKLKLKLVGGAAAESRNATDGFSRFLQKRLSAIKIA